LVGWTAETGSLAWPPVLLYVGTILWVIGYDTIYALQDIEDDALVGVKSTARLFGQHVRPAVTVLYVGAVLLWLMAALLAGAGVIFAVLMLVPAALLAWQVYTLDVELPNNPLVRFQNNHYVGIALSLALLAEWAW
jgi:4-hydroxybenzoate polyprenyltransferase